MAAKWKSCDQMMLPFPAPSPLTASSLLDVNIFQAIGRSDLIGQICLFVIAIFSVISWAVIVYKWIHLRRVGAQTEDFIGDCLEAGGSLEEAYRASAEYPDCPLAEILRETVVELEVEGWYREGYDLGLEDRLHLAQTGIERVVERTVATETRMLESHLIFLATTATVCPFIGLFGTVWGILGAFQQLSISGSAAIQALAPGISTALVTTIAGLAAAIPATVFFNWFVSRIAGVTHRMDAFSLELGNIVQRRIARGG
jgi:biopolymer transport protein TolQ